MKLNWFSPLPPAQTEIGYHTQRVLPSLSTLAEVTVWTDQDEWDPQLAEFAQVRPFEQGRIPWVELNRADMTFYQIGNNPTFHETAWQISRRYPGVVVLHDIHLHHFFDGLFRERWRDRDSYLAVMQRYYGDKGRQDAAVCYRSDASNIDFMAEHYPLTSLAIERALGVMVHSPASFESLGRDLMSPMAYAPLPFAAKPSEPQRASKGQLRNNDFPFRLILFGYIGRNRRLDSVLKSLAGIAEKDLFHLDIVGNILDDEKQVDAQISALNLENQVTLHGFTAEEQLDALLSRSDLALNLRFPTVGEASASQLRIWAHALPSLVTQVGWYGTLPSETVAFVRSEEHEIEDIQKHLKALIANPEAFAEMGEKGRKHLEKHHRPDAYAQAVIEIAEAAKEFRPRTAYLSLAERTARQTNEWAKGPKADQVFRSAAREIFGLAKRRSMRIAIDGIPLCEPLTGIGHYTLELARHLASSGTDEIFVLSPPGFLPSIDSESEDVSNLRFIQPRVNLFTRYWWSVGLPRYLRRHGIELFHGTNFEVPLRGNSPSVVTIHDLSMLLRGEAHVKKRVRRARKRLPAMARAATIIITDTEAVRREVHEYLKVELSRIVAVPAAARSCFRRLEVDQTKETQLRYGIGDEFVLYVGTIEPRKNLITLVRAFEEVLAHRESALQLVIAGRVGWMVDDLMRYIKESPFSNMIILTGYLRDEELCALYSSCTIFVYPSLYEGFGLPPLEAMACGAPVIASRIPSIAETVGEAALLFNPKDVPALASNIISLLEDENLREHFARKGIERAAQFTWERTAKLIRAVYDKVLAKNASVK